MFKAADIAATGLDASKLHKELDKVKARSFLGKNAAFLGPLMCSMKFQWTMEIPTAATNGLILWWNPMWFMSLKPVVRETVLLHELWHVAYLHMMRLGSRDPEIWNQAADIVINNKLEDDGYSFEGVEDCWKDQTFKGKASEEVYDVLHRQKVQNPPPTGGGAWGQAGTTPNQRHDIFPMTAKEQHQVVTNVVRAVQTAKMSGKPGSVPGEIELVIEDFLAPKIDWRKVLFRFFQDLCKSDYSWKKRNRRYRDIYMPSMESEGRLQKLFYFIDVSGSVTDQEVKRCNSEIAYIKRTFNPIELHVITFDVRIRDVYIFREADRFDRIVVTGRGGTSLVPVRDYILEHKPTAAVIFSDLWVDPMKDVGKIPVIWIAVNNMNAQVPFGKLIHLTE